MNPDIEQLVEVFYEEAAEDLATLQHLLSRLDPARPDPASIEAIFRAARCVNASSTTLGLADVVELTQQLEGLLDCLRKQKLALTAEMVEASALAGNVIKGLLSAHRGQATASSDQAQAVGLQLRRLAKGTQGNDAGSAETNTKKCRRACKPARPRRGST